MPKLTTENRTLKNVEVLRTPFRNFAGSPTKYNPEGGKRFFNVRLDEELAQTMMKEGWNIKELPPREDGQEPLWLLEVKVHFGGRPPRLVTVTPSGKKPVSEETVDALDAADIEYANVIIRPYDWQGKTVSAYLQTGFFHVKLDELEMMYEMDDEDPVICDDEGVCYINGVRIN